MKIESFYNVNEEFKIIKAGDNLYLPLLFQSADLSENTIYGALYLTTSEEIEFFGSKMVIVRFVEINKSRRNNKKFLITTSYGNVFEYDPVSFDELAKRFRTTL